MSYYVITCDGKVLHDSRCPDSPRVLNPKCNLEVNTSGALVFELPKTHRWYNLPRKRKSVISMFQDGGIEPIFTGQPLDDEMDFNGTKQIICEGDLGYLNDTIVRPYLWQGDVRPYLEMLIESHNAQVGGTRKQFKVGLVDVEDPNGYIYRADTTYPTTFDTIREKLWGSSLGGYIFTSGAEDHRYINYSVNPGKRNSQAIRFGENMLSMRRFVVGSNIITGLVPLGATIDDGPDTEADYDWAFDDPELSDDMPDFPDDSYIDWGD